MALLFGLWTQIQFYKKIVNLHNILHYSYIVYRFTHVFIKLYTVFVMTMLIICTAYKVTPGKSMLHALLATFIMCITELIVMVAVPDYGQNVLGYIDSFKVQVMIYYISKLLYLIFMYIASYILSKGTSRHNINIKNICTCRNMCNKRFHYKFFCILCVNISLSTKYVTLILISATVLLCLNVLTINMYNYIENNTSRTKTKFAASKWISFNRIL